MLSRALPSPPPPRRRPSRRPVDSDYEESRLPEPPLASVGRGLRRAALVTGEEEILGATSLVEGRPTGSGNSFSVVGETPPSSFEPPRVPDRCHQRAEGVEGDARQAHEWRDHSWYHGWNEPANWWTWHDRHDWWSPWSSWQPQQRHDWDGQASMDDPWTSDWSRQHVDEHPGPASEVCEKGGHQASKDAADRVGDWWAEDGKINESLDIQPGTSGSWEHFRMNASEDEALPKPPVEKEKDSKKTRRIPSSYPSSFAAQPTESYQEWKRAVQMWIAGEGGLLPDDVIGPRVLSVLKGRASILTRKLSVAQVSGAGGLDVIFKTLESSSLVQEFSGQRGERAQREFLQCRRVANESLDAFLMRVEAQRDLMLEEDAEFCMGERFLVGYVMDNAELTQRDRVLVMAAAGNKLTSSHLSCLETHGTLFARNSTHRAGFVRTSAFARTATGCELFSGLNGGKHCNPWPFSSLIWRPCLGRGRCVSHRDRR